MPRTPRTEDQKKRDRELAMKRRLAKRELRKTVGIVEDDVIIENFKRHFKPSTLEEIFVMARADKAGDSGERYDSMTHVIARSKMGFQYCIQHTQVLGYCECCKCNTSTGERLHFHYHVLCKVLHARGRMATWIRDNCVSRPLKKNGKLDPHTKEIVICCEFHLYNTAHYVSCLRSQRRGFYGTNSHVHFNLHGPIQRHQVGKACNKYREQYQKELGISHNAAKCDCYSGEKKMAKKTAKNKHREAEVEKWRAACAAASAVGDTAPTEAEWMDSVYSSCGNKLKKKKAVEYNNERDRRLAALKMSAELEDRPLEEIYDGTDEPMKLVDYDESDEENGDE